MSDPGAIFSLGSRCLPCNPKCLTCSIVPDMCTSCPAGKRLTDFTCADMFNVVYEYRIDFNYGTFLSSSKSDEFISELASFLGISVSNIHVTELYEGSTVVAGSIDTSGQNQANSIQSQLGGFVSGFTILSSSSSVYYGNQVYSPSPQPNGQQPLDGMPPSNAQNYGLIVGVTVGVIVALVITALLIYKFKRGNKIDDESREPEIVIPAQKVEVMDTSNNMDTSAFQVRKNEIMDTTNNMEQSSAFQMKKQEFIEPSPFDEGSFPANNLNNEG